MKEVNLKVNGLSCASCASSIESSAKDINELRIVTYIEKNVFKQDELIKTIENALK